MTIQTLYRIIQITLFVRVNINMSSKLVIHKIETGVNFKSLQITIEDVNNESSEIIFSEWLEGKSHQKEKDSEKSSRLVVKVVSDDEINELDLDLCAKEVVEEHILSNFTSVSNDYETQIPCYELNNPMINRVLKFETNRYYSNDKEEHKAANSTLIFQKDLTDNNHDSAMLQFQTSNDGDKSPLEYSLEKVKENNARIMENIHMLNRTLNYTKKKEILDIVSPKSMRSYPCSTCGKCFVYETGLKRHYSIRHAVAEIQPRWQVVWTCIECFQVWPRQDLALRHSSQCCKSDSIDCVREIKTSSLLQCEFCEKVFTSIPRLLRHSKTHTTENNYECNACETSFLSYKTAEQHWMLCPWLKMCYSFALPKLLLCNACDRKFRNYEHLYNHRYKVGHFTSKPYGSKSNFIPLGMLVYQCEICGQWFSSIAPLQVHKAQCHA